MRDDELERARADTPLIELQDWQRAGFGSEEAYDRANTAFWVTVVLGMALLVGLICYAAVRWDAPGTDAMDGMDTAAPPQEASAPPPEIEAAR